jgi:hypothetical protein
MKRTLLIFGLLASALLSANPCRAQETAQRAEDFIDSTGINPSFSSSLSNFPQVRKAMLDLGIKHMRFSQSSPQAISDMQQLAHDGIKTMFLMDANYGVAADSTFYRRIPGYGDPSPGYNLHDFLVKVGPGTVIDSVEMPNEIDEAYSYSQQFWHPGDFPASHVNADATSPLYWVNFIEACTEAAYKAVKSDPATGMVQIVGPALGKTYNPGNGHPNPLPPGSLYNYVDFGGFHPYPFGGNFATPSSDVYDTIKGYYAHGNFPSVNIDKYPYAFNVCQPPFDSYDANGNIVAKRPMIATESGYPTSSVGTSEALQAKYIPRLYCEYFRLGIPRTFVYDLLDNDQTFGIMHADFSPKPAYTALQSLIGLLKDKQDSAYTFYVQKLNYQIAPTPVTGYIEPHSGMVANYDRLGLVHHVLLEKSDHVFYLLLWDEVSGEDTSVTPHRVIAPPPIPVTVDLPEWVKTAKIATYAADWTLSPVPTPIYRQQVHITVPDSVEVLELR